VRLAIVLAIVAACSRGGEALQFVDVKRADLVLGVEVTGELEAVDSTDIKPPSLQEVWNFKIASLVPEGAEVKAGDELVAFDPAEQMRDLETMQNEADAQQKKLDKKHDDAALARRDEELKIETAEADLRKKTLKATAPAELVASIDLRTGQLDEEVAKMELERAKNKAAQARRADAAELNSLTDHFNYAKHRVDELKTNIAKMSLTAPRAGTVIYPNNWRGEKKKIGDTASRWDAVLKVVALGKMIGNGSVDEVDVARIAEKQPVALRLDALPDIQLRGSVASIAKSVGAKSQTDPSKMVRLKIDLAPAADTPLRPGMRFRGEVETERVANVVQVPAEAVFVTADGPMAYRETTGGVERVHLELGRRTATVIEVKSGLAAGDRVSRTDPGASP
jgi:HlyD family secretion protein